MGHRDVQAAALSPEQKSRLAKQVEARVAEDGKRHDGRVLVARVIADPAASGIAEGEDDGVFRLDPANPDHRAAVDDYFDDLVLPGFFETVLLPGNRDRIGGGAAFIAATLNSHALSESRRRL